MSKHSLNPRLHAMQCLRCGTSVPVGDYFYGCPSCLNEKYPASLTLSYQGEASIDTQGKGFARYREFLPYADTVTLGEGNTPVLSLPRLADELGVAALYTKNEFQNPTGSHKDRMNPFITARAVEQGYSTVTCASSGNEAASLAAYAAAEGIACVNVSTREIPFFWKHASAASGAHLELTDTPALRMEFQRKKMDEGWYCATNLLDVPTGSSPFGIQGYKTIAFELFEEFQGKSLSLPDVIFIPTCRGDLLYGVYEGFRDLLHHTYITALPRLAACEPFPRLELILEQGRDYRDKFSGNSSATSSIGGNTATCQSVYALNHSHGFAVNAEHTDISAAILAMGRHGLFLESSSAILYPCVQKALEQQKISAKDTILLLLTSNGYKNKQEPGGI